MQDLQTLEEEKLLKNIGVGRSEVRIIKRKEGVLILKKGLL